MGASLAAHAVVIGCGAATADPTRRAPEPRPPDWRTSARSRLSSQRADVIVSVCPPASAVEVADSGGHAGFDGIYVDVNAISPATTRTIGGRFARFVDGGVVGPPVQAAGSTRLYLSGDDADEVAELWTGHAARDPRRRGRCRRSIGGEGLLRGVDEGNRRTAVGHPRARCRGGRRGCVARRVGDIDAGSRRAGGARRHGQRTEGVAIRRRARRDRRQPSPRTICPTASAPPRPTCTRAGPVQRYLRHRTSGSDQRNAFVETVRSTLRGSRLDVAQLMRGSPSTMRRTAAWTDLTAQWRS